MRSTLCGLFAVATLFTSVAHAMDSSATAQDRATLYQQEVHDTLTRHAWRVTRDEAGHLTAERLWLEPGLRATPSLGNYARLEIGFRADDRNHTACSARASLCLYNPFLTDHVGESVYPPLPLRSPKLTQEYRDMLAEAELRLAVDHRAYAADGTSRPNVDRPGKVTAK